MRKLGILAALALFGGGAAPAQTLTLTNARIIDGTGSPPQLGQTIQIEKGLITTIVSDGEHSLPEGADVLDVGGRAILPGLIDGHVHLSAARLSPKVAGADDREAALAALLRNGVTSIRELAGDVRISRDLAQRQTRGDIQGPAIYYSAVLYGPKFLEDPRAQESQPGLDPGTAPWSRVVTEQGEIAEIIADARAAGSSGIKLYASIDASLVASLTAEAHRQGLKAWAHSVIFPARPDEIVAADVDSIIHSRGLIAAGRSDVPDSFAEGTRGWMSRLDFEGTEPESELFARLFAEMKDRGIIFEPALYADGDPAKGPAGDWRDSMRAWSCKITGAAHRAGVTISAGTDTPAAEHALYREMERLVECGLSPLEAIRAATLNNAKAIGIDKTHGTVAAGKVADLLIVDGDPASNISAISNVHMVVQNGRIVAGQDKERTARP